MGTQEAMASQISSEAKPSPLRRRLRKYLLHTPGGIIGTLTIGAFVVLAVFGPNLAPGDAFAIDLFSSLEPPSASHLLGTDELGRDVFSRILVGARLSLGIGLVSVALALVGGTILGALAGYLGGPTDSVIMRIIDVLLAYPSLLLALVTINILGPGLVNTMVAVGIASIPTFARLARGAMLSVKTHEFVAAAQAVGASHSQVVFRHCLPNMLAPLIVQATLRLSTSILTAAGLSFIGLGVQPPAPEWGTMMSEARSLLIVAPHVVTFPGLAIFLAVLGLNLFGDALRDALDPKQGD